MNRQVLLAIFNIGPEAKTPEAGQKTSSLGQITIF
jgi:hypothetical protein